MNNAAAKIGELEFLTKLQRILGEGLFVASYKYALLLALAELSVEKTIAQDGTLPIELDELADRFVTLYWRQAAPFGAANVLAQNTGRQASVINKIAALKADAPTLPVARRHPRWPGLVREVGQVLKVMPLWKLQLVGRERLDFLYEERLVDGGIVLRPGIAACFRAQFNIVKALVQTAWLSFVQQLPINRPVLGSTTDLAEFLFGAERAGLIAIAAGLRDLQNGTCFYCGNALREGGAVDHFIPWSRYPLDLGHNFVLAHATCNQDKRDMLAATGHLQRLARTECREGEGSQPGIQCRPLPVRRGRVLKHCALGLRECGAREGLGVGAVQRTDGPPDGRMAGVVQVVLRPIESDPMGS